MNQEFIDNKPMLRLSFGGASFVLPWEAGVQVLNLMKDAQPIEQGYTPGTYATFWKRADHVVSAEAFMPAQQAKLMMEGE